MPELPEVETVKRSLEPLLVNRKITGVNVYYAGVIKFPSSLEFQELIAEKEIRGINRRGKYLLFELSGGLTLVIHLRMTGQIVISPPEKQVSKHTHLVFSLSDGQEMRFIDIRKFGMIYLVPTGDWHLIGGLASLGVEPLSDDFTPQKLTELLSKKKSGIKAFLLDQTKIAGVGNIYADEALHAAGLHPERKTDMLNDAEIETLYHAVRAKLQEGIAFRGTSVRDYVDGKGEKGGFQKQLKVYDRGGKPCLNCGRPLVKTTVAGRGTVFCSFCQD